MSGIWLLIAPVPVNCVSITFTHPRYYACTRSLPASLKRMQIDRNKENKLGDINILDVQWQLAHSHHDNMSV